MSAVARRAGSLDHPQRGTARLTVRPAWLTVGVAAMALAIIGVVQHALGPVPVLLFMLAPDLAFLLGGNGPHERGQLPARAVPFYNVLHRPVGPLVPIGLALWGALSAWWLIGGLSWLAHVALDRGFGYGLRTSDGWQRG